MKFFHNIKFKLTSWYLLMVAVLVAIFGAVGYLMLADGLSRSIVTPWNVRMADIAHLPDGSGMVTGFTSVSGQIGADKGYIMVQVPVSTLLQNASDNGTIEIQTGGGKPILVDKTLLIGSDTSPHGQMWAYIFSSRNDPLNSKLVLVAQSQSDLASTLGMFRRTMLISGAITLFVAAVLGFFLVWRMFMPLRAITEAARAMNEKDLKGRLRAGRKDELGELASTLNQVFDRAGAALEAERQVVSDLSHELKMPLAIAQSEASQALMKQTTDREYQKALETVSREISHLSSVTNRLLFLARSENGDGLVKAEVNLKDLLAGIASDAEVLCESKGTAFHSDLSGASDRCLITGDAVRLRELFLNLIDNAVRYTPAGGTVCLSLSKQDGHASIAVSDTGAGIAEEHIPNLFKRFYRATNSDSRSGTGLGLAISQRIAELHGGSIEVRSKPGEGSTFTVALPLIKARERKLSLSLSER